MQQPASVRSERYDGAQDKVYATVCVVYMLWWVIRSIAVKRVLNSCARVWTPGCSLWPGALMQGGLQDHLNLGMDEKKILGKAFMVYWSWNRQAHGLQRIRWKRLGRGLH